MGPYQADSSPRTPETGRGSAAGAGSRRVDGDLVCSQDRDPMAHVADGDGLRVGRDLLAPPSGLDGSGRVAKPTSFGPGRTRSQRGHRLVSRGDRRLQHCRKKGVRMESVRILPTAENRAPSITFWLIAKAFRSPSRSVAPMCPMPICLSRCSTASRPSNSRVEVRASDRTRCMLTRRTIRARPGRLAVSEASSLASPGAASNPPNAWDATDGWWNGLLPGFIAFEDSSSATSAAPISTAGSSCSPQYLSVSAFCPLPGFETAS